MSRTNRQPAALGLRLYRALARAFPYEFKNAWGDELLHVTEEAIDSVWRRHGALGLLRLLADLAIRIPVEYAAEVRQDIRFGLRTLAHSPGFTAVALISLTLGIGVATSAFSELNGFVFRDIPDVSQPDQLVTLQGPVAYPDYQRYRARTDIFAGSFAYVAPVPFGVSLSGRTQRIWGHIVTPSYFSTLGVEALLGRLFDAKQEQPGSAPAVVVSYEFWQNHLGSDPAMVGKALRINGQPCTILGVAPRDFSGASPMVYGADLWLPVSIPAAVAPELSDNVLERHDSAIFHVAGRLQPGVAPLQAEAALDAIARQLEQQYGDPDRQQKGRRVTLLPGGKVMPVRKQDLPFLTGYFALLGGMILLIAGSNVANMMLARASDRRREIAVRLSLGAGRGRLIRQLLTECMLIAIAAGGLGFLMSVWVMHGASQFTMPYPMPLKFQLEPDGRVLLFTFGLTVFTALAFGLAPALEATRTDVTSALKEGGNVRLRRFRRLSLRNLLVVSQVAGSLALLLITGFLVIGHQRIADVNVGFDARNLYVLSLDPVRDGYTGAQAAEVFPKLLDRVRTLPAVTSASLAESAPMAMIGKPGVNFSVAGEGDAKVIHSARRCAVGRDYFTTIGIPILLGRGFRKDDETSDTIAAVVSEKLVRECWKGEDPLGRRLEIGREDVPTFQVGARRATSGRGPRLYGRTQAVQIVGVAKNIRDGLIMAAADAPAAIYLPMRPADYVRPRLQGLTLAFRATAGVDAIGAVRRQIAAMDDRLTPFNARSMPDQIDQMMFPVRAALWTYGFLGIFGLILAAVGLAGVTAYSVTQRRREIGIRMALGARGADVLRLVMKEGLVLITIGTILGLFFARAGTRALASFMAEIARTAGTTESDPVLLIGAPLLLGILALISCYVPARRSMRIDPVVALRQE